MKDSRKWNVVSRVVLSSAMCVLFVCSAGAENKKKTVVSEDATLRVESLDFEYFGVAVAEAEIVDQKLRFTLYPTESYSVFRKEISASDWGDEFARFEGQCWTDSSINAGEGFEYKFSNKENDAYITAGVQYDKTGYQGQVIVLLEEGMNATLPAEIGRWKQDLVGAGWSLNVIVTKKCDEWVGSKEAVVGIKTKIKSIYDEAPENDKPKHLIILGHVPVPYSGITSTPPDGHTSAAFGAYPSDSYYADVDGVWTDEKEITEFLNNTGKGENRVHPVAKVLMPKVNKKGDGKWDQTYIALSEKEKADGSVKGKVEMGFGRVDFFDLTYHTLSEVDIMRRYLNKEHDFRMKNDNFVIGNKTFAKLNGYVGPASQSIRNTFALGGSQNTTFRDLKIPRSARNNRVTFLQKHGPFISASTSGGAMSNGGHYGYNAFERFGSGTVVLSTWQSHEWRWAQKDDARRAFLAAPGYGLAIFGSNGTPQYLYHHTALGFPLGFGIKQTVNENVFGGIYSNSGYNLFYRVGTFKCKLSGVVSSVNASSKECIVDDDGGIRISERNAPPGLVIAWDDIQPEDDRITIELDALEGCRLSALPQAVLLEEIGGWKTYHGRSELYGEKYNNNTTYGYEPNQDYMLKDYERGVELPVKIKYIHSAFTIWPASPYEIPKGTDAHKVFAGKVSTGVCCFLKRANNPAKIVFSGLNPAKKYKISLYTSKCVDDLRGRQILTLTGNPTLRLSQVKPVENLQLLENKLTWDSPREDGILGYNVYSSAELLGRYTKENKELVKELMFACSDAKYFMVRAVQEMTTPSGSYLTESQGKFAYSTDDFTILNDSVSEGVVGTEYTTATLLTSDMTATWSVEGSLPDGLSFSETGTISGTPTKEGCYLFSVTAKNKGKSKTKDFSLTVKARVTPAPPSITILSPTAGDVLFFKEKLSLKATAVSHDGKKLRGGALSWFSDVDGEISGKTKLSKNIHKLTLVASDENGAEAQESVIVVVQEGKEKSSEEIEITAPSDGAAWEANTPISFSGTASDRVDVVWYSNLDGKIGSGRSISLPKLSEGFHEISMIATDENGSFVTATRTLTVGD